jgi:2-polyprenyl-3-methyl-5-hydroxy-6-metoxy-1,4-benzoquinol methylase
MDKNVKQNKIAWEYDAYAFWVSRYGTPAQRAKEDLDNPKTMLKRFVKYFDHIQNLKIANICGSCGKKAIPLAILGADVTIFDISKDNMRYACETAKEAGVKIDYILGDVMDIDLTVYGEYFDIVFMEGGILHYFHDIDKFMQMMNKLLKNDGTMICSDFHPINSICNELSQGKQTIDYFSTDILEGEMAHARFYDEAKQKIFPKVKIRLYTLSEIINSVIGNQFDLLSFEEHPSWTNKNLPGEFTILAKKENTL